MEEEYITQQDNEELDEVEAWVRMMADFEQLEIDHLMAYALRCAPLLQDLRDARGTLVPNTVSILYSTTHVHRSSSSLPVLTFVRQHLSPGVQCSTHLPMC